jgi:hypothetical protein
MTNGPVKIRPEPAVVDDPSILILSHPPKAESRDRCRSADRAEATDYTQSSVFRLDKRFSERSGCYEVTGTSDCDKRGEGMVQVLSEASGIYICGDFRRM